jgi:hypothetical protein
LKRVEIGQMNTYDYCPIKKAYFKWWGRGRQIRCCAKVFLGESTSQMDNFTDYAGLSDGFVFCTAEVATSRFSSQFSAYRFSFNRSAGQRQPPFAFRVFLAPSLTKKGLS